MQSYEVMFIFRPELNEEDQKGLLAELENLLKENESEIQDSQSMGKRALAYEINKQKEGIYHLMHFSSSSKIVVSKLQYACKVNDKVIRLLATKRDQKA